MIVCNICNKSFSTTSNLNRHRKENHGMVSVNQVEFEFHCPTCQKGFRMNSSKRRHMRNFHGETEPPSLENGENTTGSNINKGRKKQCSLCGNGFTDKSTLNRHMKRKHPGSYKGPTKSGKLQCPICLFIFSKYIELEQHCKLSHSIEMETVHHNFESFEDFERWKTQEEVEAKSRFIRRSSNGSKIYFICHRSGESRGDPHSDRVHWRSVTKLGTNCPARMKVNILENGIALEYQKVHVGHVPSVVHFQLCNEGSEELDGKIQSCSNEEPEPELANTIQINEEVFENVATTELNCSMDGTLAHVGENVSSQGKLQSMVSKVFGQAANAPDNAVNELLDGAKQFLLKVQTISKRQPKVLPLSSISKSPSHINVEVKKVCVIKKKDRTVEALQEETVVIHTDFDHQYL